MFSAKKGLIDCRRRLTYRCQRLDNDCWNCLCPRDLQCGRRLLHTDAPAPRVPGVQFSVHPDDWYFHQHWMRIATFAIITKGAVYYKGGVWITL